MIYNTLDSYVWKLVYKWAKYTHPKKSKRWIVDRYFGKHNKFRNDRWVFGDRSSGAYITKFAWTPIVRHILVKGGASPDDSALADYWAKRRKKVKPPLDKYSLRLLAKQDARCPLCGNNLLAAQPPQSPEQWERWWLQITRRAIVADYLVHHGGSGSPDGDQTRLTHASCHRGHLARIRRNQPQPT